VEIVVGLSVGVLQRDLGTELDVLEHRGAEVRIVGDPDFVEGTGVELDEPFPLLLGDVEPAVDVDQVLEPELPAEAVGATERLGGEGREMVHVLGLAGTEKRLEHVVCKHEGIEVIFQAVQAILTARELVHRGHQPNLHTSSKGHDPAGGRGRWAAVVAGVIGDASPRRGSASSQAIDANGGLL
jgi:hypothetical protein